MVDGFGKQLNRLKKYQEREKWFWRWLEMGEELLKQKRAALVDVAEQECLLSERVEKERYGKLTKQLREKGGMRVTGTPLVSDMNIYVKLNANLAVLSFMNSSYTKKNLFRMQRHLR